MEASPLLVRLLPLLQGVATGNSSLEKESLHHLGWGAGSWHQADRRNVPDDLFVHEIKKLDKNEYT